MKPETRRMLARICRAHDWYEGQVFSLGAALEQRDVCLRCGVIRDWYWRDGRGVYDFYDRHGNPLPYGHVPVSCGGDSDA
jgi:hypothetical protein